MRFIHQRPRHAALAAALSSEGVPAGGIGDHPFGMDLLAVGQLHAYRLAALKQHLGDPGLVANGAAMALQAAHQFLGNHPHPSLGVVDTAGMAIGEHHPRVDHRGEIRGHHRPAEALHVDELQQGWIADVGSGHIAHVHRQPAGQAQASQGGPEKHLGQVGRILEGEERHRIEAVEHLPAGVIEAADPLGLMGEEGTEPLHKAGVIPIDGHGEPTGKVVLQLGWIGDGFAVLPHIGKGPGEQVGVALIAKAKDHRGAHVEGVAVALEAASGSARDQVTLQHQHLGALGGELGGRHQAANARANDDGV